MRSDPDRSEITVAPVEVRSCTLTSDWTALTIFYHGEPPAAGLGDAPRPGAFRAAAEAAWNATNCAARSGFRPTPAATPKPPSPPERRRFAPLPPPEPAPNVASSFCGQ